MGFFWVFLGFYGFFWFFWVFWVFLFGTLDSCITGGGVVFSRFLKVSLTTPISLRISRVFLLMTKMFHLDATSRKFSIFFSLERGFII